MHISDVFVRMHILDVFLLLLATTVLAPLQQRCLSTSMLLWGALVLCCSGPNGARPREAIPEGLMGPLGPPGLQLASWPLAAQAPIGRTLR